MDKSLNLIGPLNGLGYGVATQNILRALFECGTNVSYFPIPSGELPSRMDIPNGLKTIANECMVNAGFYDPTVPCLKIWQQNDMAERVGRGLQVGFPFFELDRFNAREKHHLGQLDRIFVTSEWGVNVIWSSLSDDMDVRIVPLGVDRSIFNEDVRTDRLAPDYTVFVNVGKWEVRKGHDVLLEAFNRAFLPVDKVLLKMLCYNPFIGSHNDVWARRYLGSPAGQAGQIKLAPRLTNQEAVARFIMAGDCAVFPARAEGWNLELLESLSLGKHVIATFATAHTEYIDEDNARLIRFGPEMELAQDGIWFHGQGEWPRWGPSQEEQLIEHMREVHRLKQTGQLQVNEAGIQTARTFSWESTAAKILQGLTP